MSRFFTLAGAAVVALAALPASAYTITFANLPGSNGDTFAAPYSEGGYTVTPTSGSVKVAKQYGNPIPDLFFVGTGGSITVTGGLFTLSSFDAGLGSAFGNSTYTITGSLNGTQDYFATYVNSTAAFNTITTGSGATLFDTLTFALSTTSSSANIDNIVVNAAAVPEPASWAMFIGGFGLIGAVARRRTSVSFA